MLGSVIDVGFGRSRMVLSASELLVLLLFSSGLSVCRVFIVLVSEFCAKTI